MKVDKNKKFTRFTAFVIIILLVFIGIVSRLVYLQVLNSQQFKEKANNRSIKEIPEPAPRGEILDRNNNVLATNKQNYMLVYNQTPESKEVFLKTMKKVFDILDERKQEQTDDFELKINPYRFEFKSDDPKVKKALELRFKKDRGLDEEVRKKIFKDKHKEELTDKDKKKIDEELAKITPKEVFDFLVKQYKIDGKGYSLKDQRRYMIVKDTAKMQRFTGYKPVTIANDITKETATIFLQKLNDLPGIDVTTQPVRIYPNKEVGSATLGYISKISGDRDKYKEKGYDVSSDYIGINGIEGVYESRLKGSKGGKIVKLNKNGRIVEELGRREPYPGQTLQLTIDKNIQAAAEKSLDETMKSLRNRGESANATRGAAVAVDVNTGEILALASRPGFDPNIFSTPGKLTPDKYKEFFNPDLAEFGRNYINNRGLSGGDTEGKLNELFPIDKRIKNNKTIREDVHDVYPKPLYNYATMSVVPPGSTFKPMTAIAGLESGSIGQGFSIDDTGIFDDGKNFIKKFPVGGYGSVDLTRALEVSSNPYFMNVGKRIRETGGDDLLAKYAWKFGLGVPPNSDVKPATGIEIPENFGQVFNTYTLSNVYAQQYLWQTMSTLKKGKDSRGNQFPTIDLYDRDSDTEKVKEIKTSIKNLVKQSIKEGSKKFNSEEYKKLFKQLISEDSAQKNKSITDNQISRIIDVISYITISDAHSQLKTGFNMYNASIGQGISNFTPLQLANYVATIANGGDRYNLHLVKKILDSDKNVIQDIKPEIAEKTNVSKENIAAVIRGMKEVTGGEGGTAANAFKDLPVKVAAKTGSADISENQEEYGRNSYATLIAFAPADNPKIAVSVVVFDGQHGGYVAPVANAIFKQYFNKNKKADTKSK